MNQDTGDQTETLPEAGPPEAGLPETGPPDAAPDAEKGWYDESQATLGDRLTAAREAAGLSLTEMASRLGVRARTLRDWENDVSEPRANRLQMLAALLGVSLRWLLTGQGDDVPAPSADQPAQDPELRSALSEVRRLRADLSQAADRLGRLEKALRRSLESGARHG